MNKCLELLQDNTNPQKNEMKIYLPNEPDIIARPWTIEMQLQPLE